MDITKKLLRNVGKARIITLNSGAKMSIGIESVDEAKNQVVIFVTEALRAVEEARKNNQDTEPITSNPKNYKTLDISDISDVFEG